MRSLIYDYLNESTAAIIEDAINDNTVKIRILPIQPSDPRYSGFSQYKLVMNQHTVHTAESHEACLFEASKILDRNYYPEPEDTFTPPSVDFIPTIFSENVAQMNDYAQRGYRSLAEVISMDDMEHEDIQQHIIQEYKTAKSVVVISDEANRRYFIKPHENTRQITYGVDYELGEEGQIPTLITSKNIDAYSHSALRYSIKQSIKDRLGDDTDLTNLRIKIYDEPF